jgi:hypothetical protein
MTDEFYRQNNWSAADKDRFNDITGSTPTFLISGKNQHFSVSFNNFSHHFFFNFPSQYSGHFNNHSKRKRIQRAIPFFG